MVLHRRSFGFNEVKGVVVKRLKSSAKVAKTAKKKQPAMMPKTKGLDVLSEVALSEAEQIKLATRRSKKDFHMSHASGSGDGVDTHQNDEDADEETDINDESEETESNIDGDDLTHPNLSTYKADYKEEEEKADDKEEEEKADDDEEQDEEEELYGDLNINLQRSDAEMTDAQHENVQANQVTKNTHVTLTIVPPAVQHQSCSVSSDLVFKFINPYLDIGIDTILNQNVQSQYFVNVPVFVAVDIPFSDTTDPQTPIPIILPLQQTPESTATITIPTTTLPDIPNFASLFQFDQQMKDEVDVAVQLQTNKLREEAQAENQEFLNQVDSTMKTIIKEQVQAQVSKIMPKIEKYVTESLGSEVLVRSTNQPQTSYVVATSLSEFELKKIPIDKMKENQSRGRDDKDKDENPSAGSNRGSNRRRSSNEAELSKEPTHKESKSTSSSQIVSRSQPKSSGKSAQAEDHGQAVDDLEEQTH
nr:hypothetical protein [Tanacetum cinerariifolium]